MLLVVVWKKRGIQPIISCLFAALVMTVIDETIQIFSSCGSQVADVLLDFTGEVTAIVFVLLIRWLVLAIRRKHGRAMYVKLRGALHI